MSLHILRLCVVVLFLVVGVLQSVSAAHSLIPAGATTFTFSDHRMPHASVDKFCKLHGKRPAMIPMPKLPLVAKAMLTRYNGPATAWTGYENMKAVDSNRQVVVNVYCEDIFAPGSENSQLYNYAVCE